MNSLKAKSAAASRLRQRRYRLARDFNLPQLLFGGSLSQTHRRCGKKNCHCAQGRGHAMWSLTSSHRGRRRVERVPREWLEEVEQAVLATHAYMDAIKEVQVINIELLAQTRRQQQHRKSTLRAKQRKKRTQKLKKRSTFVVGERS